MRKFFPCALIVCLALHLLGCGKPTITPTPFEGEETAVISVYAFDPKEETNYGLLYLGHAFLSFENTGTQPLAVGVLSIEPGESCSVGSWGMSAHFGIWYNIESAYIAEADKYVGRVSLSKSVTAEGMTAVNEVIAKNDKWTLLGNCSKFAASVFNAAGGDTVAKSGVVTPSRLADEIRQYSNAEIDRPISNYGKIGFSGRKEFQEYAYTE